VPCSTELGYDITLPQFRSYVVKAGTPADRVKTLSDAMAKVAATDEYKKFLEEQYAAADSFVPADKAVAFLQAQLADMKAAMAMAKK
jgi:tripartite-type tricarboxylate transporter receptor subunit TctC